MKFSDLSKEEKESFSKEILSHAMNIGSKNALLQLIEDVKSEADSPFSAKDKSYSFAKGFVRWDKVMYKETLDLLFTAILTQEREGDALIGLKHSAKKRTINMFRALKPVSIMIKPKNAKEGEGFAVPILEVVEGENTKISLMFRALFFYNISFAKQALSYEV